MTRLLILLLAVQSPPDTSFLLTVAPAETVRVTVSGVGQPVFLVPGLLGSSFAFRKIIPLLNQAGFRTFSVDLLGTGRSARPRDADYSLDAQSDRLGAVMDSMGVMDATLVAHAIGCSIALRLSLRRPELVGGLVLLEGGPAESATTPGFRRAMKLAPLIKLLGKGKARSRVRDQLIDASGDSRWVDAAVVQGYTEDAARDFGATLDVFRAMAAARERDSITSNLPAIQTPVLLLIGGAAHTGGPGAAEVAVMARLLPAFAADTLAGVGHFPHEEAPHLVRDAVLQMQLTRAALTGPRPPR